MSLNTGGAQDVKAVLFDLDGTFVDTAPDMARALNIIRADRGLDALPHETIRPHVSRGARGMIEVGFGIDGQHDGFPVLRDAFYEEYLRNLCVESTLFDGIDALMVALEHKGVAWGIVTNKAARFALPIAQTLGFAQRAACIVCGDTTAHTKPHPAPLLHAAGLIGVAPRHTLYVGDDARDIEAATAAGMRGVVAAYGYLATGSELQSWGASFSIARPADLMLQSGW